jgi:hypothetical protein
VSPSSSLLMVVIAKSCSLLSLQRHVHTRLQSCNQLPILHSWTFRLSSSVGLVDVHKSSKCVVDELTTPPGTRSHSPREPSRYWLPAACITPEAVFARIFSCWCCHG